MFILYVWLFWPAVDGSTVYKLDFKQFAIIVMYNYASWQYDYNKKPPNLECAHQFLKIKKRFCLISSLSNL